MASHDPDDFLADVSEDRDYPRLLFPATVKLAKEEELDRQSNKDAFHAVETRMLSNAQQQNHRVSASVVEAGIGKSLLRSMPARKCKKNSVEVKNKPGRLCPEDSAKVKRIERECTHCGITQTPQWRHGPLGRMTLCNACGVRYKCGRLCPEYRPANSPTFSDKLHSNAHRKVMEIRKQKYGTVSKPVNKCTTTLMKSKKDSFPAVEILNILEQPSGVVIAEQQSPVLVLENSTNRSATLLSSCGTNEPPHQTPKKFMGQQQLFCNQANKPNKKDTANVEIEGNSPATMRSCGMLELPHQVPSEFLGQQQLFCNQPNNESNKKDTGKVRIQGKCQNCGAEQSLRWWEGPLGPKTLCLSCGRLAKYTAGQQRSMSLASNKTCNKKDTAKVKMAVKPVDKCRKTCSRLSKH